jgi:hypothetical protein
MTKEEKKEYNKTYRNKNKGKKREYMQGYYEKNKEKIKEYRGEYSKLYYEKNKEEIKGYMKKYSKIYKEKNKERLLEYAKKYHEIYRQNNKEKIAGYYKKYRKENKEYFINATHIRRARIKGNGISDVTKNDLQRLLSETVYCVVCSNKMGKKSVDHIKPLCMGGTHTLDNIRIICLSCNGKRPKDGRDILTTNNINQYKLAL